MIGKCLVMAATVVAAVGAIMVPSTAFAATAPVSSIDSAAQSSCLDTSTTSGYFLNTYGKPCDGAASQQFAFHALSGEPAGTYEITSVATGECMVPYGDAMRQASCTGAVPPDPAGYAWTLKPVGTTGNQYLMELTYTVGSSYPTCVQVAPEVSGFPGPTFEQGLCSASNPDQILTLTTTP